MLMTKTEKAVENLKNMGIDAEIFEDESVYIYLNDTSLQLSKFEVNYQSERYDETKEEEEINDTL